MERGGQSTLYFYCLSRARITLANFIAVVFRCTLCVYIFCGLRQTYKVKHEFVSLSTLSLNSEPRDGLVDLSLISGIYK